MLSAIEPGDLMTIKRSMAIGAIILFILASAFVGYISERPQGMQTQRDLMHDVVDTTSGANILIPFAGKAAPPPAAQAESYAGQTPTIEKKTIFTATISLEVKEYSAAVDKVSSIASRYGGYVSNTSMNNEGAERKSGYVMVRVPEKDFAAAIAELEKVGEVKDKNVSGEEVTEQYIDLEARLNNLKLEEQRYIEIMKKTEKVEDMLAIEKELSRVRGDIESMQGQLNFLKNRVDLATITVNLTEPEVVVHESKFMQAINAAIEGFLATIRGMIILVGYLLPPFIILLLIGGMWKVVKTVKK